MEYLLENKSFSFRWINVQCFEFKLPNGKTILTDPCFDYPDDPSSEINQVFSLKGFHVEDIEACDYLIINHTHCDHIANLETVVNRFHPIVICHSGVAAEIARLCRNACLTNIYPVDYNGTYYFDGFRLDTYHGAHKPQRMSWASCEAEGKDPMTQDARFMPLHTLGGFFNMNFLITLENGFRIAFVGGLDDGMKEHLRTIRPNIALRNKLANEMDVDTVARDWLSFMRESYAQIVIPMHFEVWENLNPGFSEQTFAKANELAQEEGLPVRMLAPKRTEWYDLMMTVVPRA